MRHRFNYDFICIMHNKTRKRQYIRRQYIREMDQERKKEITRWNLNDHRSIKYEKLASEGKIMKLIVVFIVIYFLYAELGVNFFFLKKVISFSTVDGEL